jgi:hypothetical protein
MALKDFLSTPGRVLVLIVQSEAYHATRLELLKALSEVNEHNLYVTVNRSCSIVSGFAQAAGADLKKFNFVDATEAAVEMHADTCFGLASPSDLSSIAIKVEEGFKRLGEGTFVVLDASTTLQVYSQEEAVIRFLRNMGQKAELHKGRVLFLALAEETSVRMLAQLTAASDNLQRVTA